MTKPYLLVVSGRPGSGKTTFAETLGKEICMQVISRDRFKEGYVHTQGKGHLQLPAETNGIVNEVFFSTLMRIIEEKISVIAEAAFQHKLWSAMLEPFVSKAQIVMLICKVNEQTAQERYISRKQNDPLREHFHGDIIDTNPPPYEAPHMNLPTFEIDTSGEYKPSIRELKEMIFHENSK